MFELSGRQALVKSCKGRRGKSDDAVRAMVVVLEVEDVLASNVAALFGVKDAAPIHASYFEQISETSSTQDKLYPGITHIAVSYYAEGKHELKFGKFAAQRTAWLGSITVVPRMAGKFDVRFLATIEEPQSGLMDAVSDHINRCMRIDLTCDPGFDFQIKDEQAPVTMELPLEQSDRDREQLDQAAKGLGGAESAEVPIKTKGKRKAPAKKAAGKRMPKKAA